MAASTLFVSVSAAACSWGMTSTYLLVMLQELQHCEVTARGGHDCWVIGKHAAGRELFLVLEGRGEHDLKQASRTSQMFIDKHFQHAFPV